MLCHHCAVSSQEAIFENLDRTDNCCPVQPSIVDFNLRILDYDNTSMIDIMWSNSSCPGTDNHEIIGYIITYGCAQQDMLDVSNLMNASTCNLGSLSMTLELPVSNMQDWECIFSVQGVVQKPNSETNCVTNHGTCTVIAASSYNVKICNGNSI